MTGYLQRLVATAVQGEVGVHPIVRPPRIGPGAEAPAWAELADEAEFPLDEGLAPGEATAPGDAGAAPVATPVPDDQAPGHDRPPPAAGHVRDRTAAGPPRVPEIMTPLFGEMPTVDPATPVPAARIGSITRPPVMRRSRPGPVADHPRGPTHERYTPADPARSSFEPATARPGPSALPQVTREPQHLAGPTASGHADRAGDVEIYIGRIEVTAASPPPALPVPKAARKAIKLDDYLRNRR